MPISGPALRAATVASAWSFACWRFGESICLEALLAMGGSFAETAKQTVARWAMSGNPPQPLVHLIPGVPILEIANRYERLREPMLTLAFDVAQRLLELPRGRYGALLHRPDHEAWRNQVWVDCLQMDGPFLARLGKASGRQELTDAAASVAVAHARVLQDGSGLLSHGFDDSEGAANGIHWARGQGWALLGLVDTLAIVPDSTEGASELRDRLVALLNALIATNDGGRWHSVVDIESTTIEASLSAFVSLGLNRARRARLIASEYTLLEEHAWRAARGGLSATGGFEVSEATPVSTSVGDYASRRTGIFPWGQGPFILMELERELGTPSQIAAVE